DERQITIQNEDVAPRQPVCRNLGHRMAGPERLVLQDDFAAVLEGLRDRLLAGRAYLSYVWQPCDLARGQDQVDHGRTAEPVQDLGATRTHARAEPGG